MLTYTTAIACAFVASLVTIPIVRALAIRFGVVDKPDPRRKLHTRVVARAGGWCLRSRCPGQCCCLYSVLPPLELRKHLSFRGPLSGDAWNLRSRASG